MDAAGTGPGAGLVCTRRAPLPLSAHRRRAARNAVTWGDFSSLETILHHVLRRDYGTFQLGAGEAGQWGAWGRWLLVMQALFRNTLYVGLPVAFLGCVYGAMGARKDRDVVAVMLVGWLAYLAMIGFLFNLAIETPVLVGVEARFWQMAAIPVFAWAGLGVQRLVSRLVPGNSVETAVVTIAVVAIGLQCAIAFSGGEPTRQLCLSRLCKHDPRRPSSGCAADFEQRFGNQ